MRLSGGGCRLGFRVWVVWSWVYVGLRSTTEELLAEPKQGFAKVWFSVSFWFLLGRYVMVQEALRHLRGGEWWAASSNGRSVALLAQCMLTQHSQHSVTPFGQ